MTVVLFVSPQKTLFSAFQNYSKNARENIILISDIKDGEPDAVLLDGGGISKAKLKKLSMTYKNYPVFLMNLRNERSFDGIPISGQFLENTPICDIMKLILIFNNQVTEENYYRTLSTSMQLVLESLANELPDKVIARQTNLPITQVKYYMRQLFKELGVNNRKQAALKAREIIL